MLLRMMAVRPIDNIKISPSEITTSISVKASRNPLLLRGLRIISLRCRNVGIVLLKLAVSLAPREALPAALQEVYPGVYPEANREAVSRAVCRRHYLC